MPEELWAAAVQMAELLGVWQVARELGLRYESLKRRVEEKAARKKAPTGFVEFRGADLVAEAAGDGTVIEVATTDGTRMVIRLGRGATVDPVTLLAAFRQQAQ